MNRCLPIFRYALVSLFITAVLAVAWMFLSPGTVSWTHVLDIVIFVGVSLGIMSFFTKQLISELANQDSILKKVEDERRMFSADAAHELRTPLAVLRAHLDSLDPTETTDQLRQDVDHITRILEQVLVKARIETMAVKPGEQTDLSRVALDMAAYLAPLVIKEGRSIEVLGADRPVMINGNTFAVEQALRNLVENAIKYSARGSTITIEVAGAAYGDGPSMCVIDHGRGIPPEEREVIFERFRRVDQRGSGSGLGLSIVQRVAEAHGGGIRVTDAPGGGAMFTLQFPSRI